METSSHSAAGESPLWRWPELREALGLPPLPGPEITGLAIDSRKVEAGDLFIALPGDPGPRFHASSRSNRDGHDFAVDARRRGAAGALVHRSLELDMPLLRVGDTLDGLWALGCARRAQLAGDLIAVTGSSGKTTAKTLLAAALDAFATPGSLNNHLGVPLSLARTPRAASAAVYEIGTSHPGEIAPLAELVRPQLALVLNVHPAHAEFFASRDQLRKEKLSIYKGLDMEGHLIVEASIELKGLPRSLDVLRFGDSQGCHCRLRGLAGNRAEYLLDGRPIQARVPGGGRHRALLLGAALCAFSALGRDPAPALNLPERLIPAGRGNALNVAGILLIDDSYNANPASMKAALENLRNDAGRTVAVLGEMLELGERSREYHEGLAPACAAADLVVAVGDGMQALFRRLRPKQRWLWREQADEALLDILASGLQPGDLVLVKGSNRVFWASGFVQRLRDRLQGQG